MGRAKRERRREKERMNRKKAKGGRVKRERVHHWTGL
jgi:hypothetical protein